MDFGRKIRKLRKDKNMKQQDLAELMGLHMNTISHWENLESPFENVRKLSRLAEVLGTTVAYLQGEDGESSPSDQPVGLATEIEKAEDAEDTHITRATLDLESVMKDLVHKYPDLAIGFRDTRENWESLPENDKESIADALMLAFGPEGYVPKRLRKKDRDGMV